MTDFEKRQVPAMAATVTRYRLVAPCVPMRARNYGTARGGWRLVHLYAPGLVPVDAHPDDIARVLGKGLIEEVANAG